MDLFDAINGRRSMRHFRPGAVPDLALERLLRAGMAAPSAGNEQPWHFVIIRERATLAALSASHPYAGMVRDADLALLVCADLTAVKHRDFWPQDCAAATQNILLAAHALGLGSVWVGVYPRESRMREVRSIITLPDAVEPFSLLPVGFPREQKGPEDRFLSDRIHVEVW